MKPTFLKLSTILQLRLFRFKIRNHFLSPIGCQIMEEDSRTGLIKNNINCEYILPCKQHIILACFLFILFTLSR